MAKRTEFVKTFVAVNTAGKEVSLHMLVDIIDAGSFGDPNAEIRGLKSLKTNDGLSVNRHKKGEYEIVTTGELLTSNDPDAP